MKRFLTLRNALICISFTVLLLLVKDNMKIVWDIICTFAAVLTPFIIGFLFAYILNYPYKFFYSKAFAKVGSKNQKLIGLRKALSVICTYAIVLAIVVVLIWIVVPQIIDNISTLAESMPAYFESLMNYINDFIAWLNNTFSLGINEDNILSMLVQQLFTFLTSNEASNFASEASNYLKDMLIGTALGVYNFIMAIIISVYFLAAKDQLCRQIKKLAVAFIPIKQLPRIYEIVDITDTKCGRFLVGDIIDAAVVGVLHFIVLAIFQVPYSPLIAVLVGITNIIPFFGPFIGSIPSCFILLLVNPWEMIKFLIINIIIQQIDGNFIKPKIIGGQVGLSSFWVLFSVLVGGSLFGIVGLILGTPIYAVIYYLIQKQTRIKIEEKGKIAQEALDFEVLNYAKIAKEQKRIQEEKESIQREKLRRLMHLDKSDKTSENDKENNNSSDTENSDNNEDNKESE